MSEDPRDDRTVTSEETSELEPRRRRPDSRLGTLASFSELRSRQLREIESRMDERHFDAGDYLMRQGDPGDCLMVVQGGRVEVSVTTGETRHILKRSGAGHVFGEMALLTSEPRTADVVALTPVQALVLPVEDFHRLLEQQPALAEVLSRLTARRLGRKTFDALSGKIFHGYTILSRLGRGGMSVVYEAEEQAGGRRVALKMLSHRLVFREASRRRFKQEADIIESFEHENIARMFGRFEAFRTFFIVMEFCDGVTLESILASRQRLEPDQARPILGQLASALAYAHERRIVHRDVKPSNVMITRDGRVKLMDFGVAQALGDDEDLFADIVGTPPYAAPEQLYGTPPVTETDLYGLAGLTWKMLTGKTVFESQTLHELREEHQQWKAPDIAKELPGLEEELRTFVSDCLDQDPRRRRTDLQAFAGWASPVAYDELVDDET